MICLTVSKMHEPSNYNPAFDLGRLKILEGLVRDLKQLPLFSMFDLFEALLKSQKIKSNFIAKKISALFHFITKSDVEKVPYTLRKILAIHSNVIEQHINNRELFYNSAVLQLFSYAFKLRLELYHHTDDRVSVQYFGIKGNPTKRVLISEHNYVLLKRTLNKLNFASSQSINGFSPRAKLIKVNSLDTLTTKPADDEVINFELNQCLSPTNSINFFRSNEKQQDSLIQTLYSCQPSLTAIEDFETNHKVFTIANLKTLPTLTNIDSTNTPLDSPKHPMNFLTVQRTPGKSTGHLKFYNEAKEYGFIIMEDNTEVFVHKADLLKQNIDTRHLAQYKKHYEVFMEFNVQEYMGKTKQHRKAVDVVIYDMLPL